MRAIGTRLFSFTAASLASTSAAERARDRLRRALAVQPEPRSLHWAMARVFETLDLPQLAFLSLERAASTDANGDCLVAALRALGRGYLARGRLAAAENCFTRLVGQISRPEHVVDLVTVLLRTGKRDAAVGLLTRSIAAFPFQSSQRRRLARLLEELTED